MTLEKIEAALLSDATKAHFATRRTESIHQHLLQVTKADEAPKRHIASGVAAQSNSLNIEAELKKSKELYLTGDLSEKAFIQHYRKMTDVRTWPSVIIVLRDDFSFEEAGREVEATGYVLAETPFGGAPADKFSLFGCLQVHIPPDQVFLNNMAGKDFSSYIFDAERVVSLPQPVRPVKAEAVRPDFRTLWDAVFPEGYGGCDVPGSLGADVTIGIVDSGIDSRHSDFHGRITARENFSQEADNRDRCGHGTHVAGIAAGSGVAADGKFPGIAPRARLLAAKVFDVNGEATTQQILAGMRWVYEQGADIINLSLGADDCPTDGKSLLSRACDALVDRGRILCVSAGNDGPAKGSISSPGDARDTICVGAADGRHAVAYFSSRGPTDDPDYTGRKPDIIAPGIDIIAARSADASLSAYRFFDDYTVMSGTSMSTPVLAGACALLLSYAKSLPREVGTGDIKAVLNASADSLEEDTESVGNGFINGSRAFVMLSGADSEVNLMKTRTVERSPRFLGKYEVVEEVGNGGFGVVYKVKPPNLDTFRAMKVPNDAGIGRELSEANKQVKLSHSAVIQVHDVEQLDGDKWGIIMDYAGGGSLRERLTENGALPVKECVAHTESLAEALKEAHGKNLLHYDVKPENILFDDSGQVKLADFGVARQMQAVGAKMSRVIGTIEYIGPEQLSGEEDPRSDIWSLGTVFYEMLTGSICFEARTEQEALKKIMLAEFTPVKTKNPAIPDPVCAIIDKMVTLDPKKRYRDMQQVIDDLDNCLETEARPDKAGLPAGGILVSLVLIAAIGGGMFYYQASREPVKNLAAQPPKQVSVPLKLPADIQKLSYEAKFEKALAITKEGNYALAQRIFQNVVEGAETPHLQEEAAFYRISIGVNHLKDSRFALPLMKEFLKDYPGSRSAVDIHFMLGSIYYDQENWDSAIEHFSEIVKNYSASHRAQAAEIFLKEINESKNY